MYMYMYMYMYIFKTLGVTAVSKGTGVLLE